MEGFRFVRPVELRFRDLDKVLVHYDYATGRSLPLTPELREKIKAQDPDLAEEQREG